MASYKCKMCGAPLDIEKGQTVATCSFCGSKQTVANLDDERKEALFNRANTLRINCEFDKALLAYQSILSIFPEEPEAHWGVALCKYGIEYVDDPATNSKKPTIHRMSFESILKDSDYISALAYSDVVAKEQYQTEAKEIDNIQKNILAISQKEEPFDIFICYKETNEQGKRTRDSVMAQEIYTALTDKGYKVFFSRITLENKLGTLYEPYIFAALNSAKIMIVIGTKTEYFNAVWVKNEWSRFISLMQTRPDHYLIPCYKDMNAYEMPEEFLSFQAQDLGKLGFMQDLIRGIDKIMGKEETPKVVQNETTIIDGSVNIKALLKRAEILLSDEDYDKADELLERVLDNDPTNSKAYLFKLLIDLQLSSIDELRKCTTEIESNSNFKKAYQFGSDEEKEKLESITDKIKINIKDKEYLFALKLKNEKQYENAIERFDELGDYKDSKAQIEECNKLFMAYKYNYAIQLRDNNQFDEAMELLKSLDGYNDSSFQIEECIRLKEEYRKEQIYSQCLFKGSAPVSKLEKACEMLKSISGYKDSDALLEKYRVSLRKYRQLSLQKHKKQQAKNIALTIFEFFCYILLIVSTIISGLLVLIVDDFYASLIMSWSVFVLPILPTISITCLVKWKKWGCKNNRAIGLALLSLILSILVIAIFSAIRVKVY